jgi:hypothetical protein
MIMEIDILENDIIEKYPKVLDILLKDHTTQQNIFWATNNYSDLGSYYTFLAPITPDLITGENGHIIMPRVKKDRELQITRVRDMAEVFTPSWICNAQNNLIDHAWFECENVFNTEFIEENGDRTWITNEAKIKFPKGKTWKQYIKDTRLEITCGEAPYLSSRYDTTTGEFIPVEKRIGLLDRKLRVINENVKDLSEWLPSVQIAYKSIYGFEWQGDSLLIARETLLSTFIENHILKFGIEPPFKSILDIAQIISWNIWQMDGLKGVIPNSCEPKVIKTKTLFEEIEDIQPCEGCSKDNILKHNGRYCLIKDWTAKETETGENGKLLRFVDLLNK